jgi:hypothetical protein
VCVDNYVRPRVLVEGLVRIFVLQNVT